jgi:PAS domain S-box-containing protein
VPHSLTDLAGLEVRGEDLLAAVLKSAQAICVVDPDGRIRFVNPAAVAALGYDSPEELLGRRCHETIHYRQPDGTSYPAADCPILLPSITGETLARDLDWFCRRDGSTLAVSYVSLPITMPEGQGVVVSFTDLASRAPLARLAEEQAALRRVATLVARGVPDREVFTAVAEEAGQVLGVDATHLARLEPDGTSVAVGAWSRIGGHIRVGMRLSMDGQSVSSLIAQTGHPARLDSYDDAVGPIADAIRALGIRASVGCPITVDGRLWGLVVVSSKSDGPLPADTESRLGNFTDLIATAIANTEARTELAASRARIVAAADAERRRLVRDLHDGAQQRLVHTMITLKLAQRALGNDGEDLPALLAEALDHAERATTELRELAHGILPHVLTQGGLRAAVDALASRMPLAVTNGVGVGRLPPAVEATAYFVVAEALTNVAKHAGAQHATVTARVDDDTVRVEVRDDGVGGARPDGTGLLGLADRLAAANGHFSVDSPAECGTLVAADVPLPSSAPAG